MTKIEFANKVKDFKREGYSAKQAQYLAYEHFGENPPPLLFGQIEMEERDHKEMSKYVELEPIKYIALKKKTKNNPWRVKSNAARKYNLTEEQFVASYEKHNGNYARMERELLGLEKEGIILGAHVKLYSWWSIEKYPKRGGKKYNISEEQFLASYEKHNGNYVSMERELTGASSTGHILIGSVQNLSWWSIEKYPRRGAKKYNISEEQFLASHEKHNGNYVSMERELLGVKNKGSTLKSHVKNRPWWSVEKYPMIGRKKYEVTEEEFAFYYKKNNGNYSRIEKGLLHIDNKGETLYGNVRNRLWWSSEKYPRTGKQKYDISEVQFADSYEKNNGSYASMARELLGVDTDPTILYGHVKNRHWWSVEKYPRKRKEKSLTPKKKLNRGSYQNAVSMALASKIGMNVPGQEQDQEISSDADLLLKDINDLASDGLSVEQIAEELNIERAIVKRALETKVKSNPKKKATTFLAMVKSNCVGVKSNPIKKERLPSGDIRVFRTEDDKFVIVKKEKKSYGVYPGGSQFKRIGTPNKVAAIDKAIEILSRRNNPKRKSNPKDLEAEEFELDTNDGTITYQEVEIGDCLFYSGKATNPVMLHRIDASEAGKGQGTKLMKTFINKMKNEGYDLIYLYATYESEYFEDEDGNTADPVEGHKRLVNFYEKLGFKKATGQEYGEGLQVDMYLEIKDNFKAIKILSRKDNPKRKSNPPKDLEQLLYHGSPTKGIKQFSTKFRRFDTQAEGEGVYLTSDVNVARCYSGDEGSIYKVKIKHTDVFNARNETGFLKILNAVKLKTGIDLLQYKIIRDTVSAMKDGDYSVMGSNGLVWQIELILSNDSGFMQKYGDLNLEEVVRAAREEIDKVKVMCYMDPSISDRPLYLVKDPSVIRIINEYPASKVKIKSEGLGVVLQSRPERSMGVKRQHEPEDDIDNEVRELIIKLYAEMTPMIEIARRVHLNPNLVKQVLINEGIEIRKGKPQKKSNPRVDVKDFMKEAAKSIVPLYEKLQVMKFGSGEFDQLMPIIIWSQGTFLFWPDNAIVTAFMIQALFESSSKVTDMKKTFKEVVGRVVFDRSRTNKIVKKLDPKSLAVKTIDFFNNDDRQGSMYFSFMERRKKEFCKNFFELSKEVALIDFVNFLRDFSAERYSEKHEVLIKELKKQIMATGKVKDQASQELIIADTNLKDIHHDAMIVIARSKEFLEGFTK